MKKYNPLPLLLIILLCFSCGNHQGNSAESASGLRKNNKVQLPQISIDGIPLNVEIVQEDEARQKGLMNREEMHENQGMLFVFEVSQILSFWMRNTFIPLDIAFIDENGAIVDIQRMEPLDESVQYISAKPALYALEVNAGWFAKHGIKVRSKVSF